MEKTNKRKAKAVAIAAAVILALAGTMAYLADASGIIRNQWDPNHVEVDIAETDVAKDDGTKDYSIIPGATDPKDPKITVDTDTDAYVFAAVKDNINNAVSGTTYVEYEIADGWIELKPEGNPSDMISQTITKYLKTFKDHKVAGSVTIDPNDANTKIYYRVVHGTNLNHEFGPFSVLKDDQVHYPSTLTNAELDKLTNGELTDEDKQLTFATYAIQMDPFCDPAEADETKIEAGAKDAWNQQGPVEKITVTAAGDATEVEVGKTLQMSAAVEPSTAKDTSVTWSVEPGTGAATIDQNGLLTGGTAGTVTVVATAKDGSGVKGTYEVTVTAAALGHIKWQVQLHSTEDSKATFWPAAGNSYGSHCDGSHCICDATWAEIAADPSAYDACKAAGCTKTVTIDETSDDTIFTQNLTKDQTSGMLYSTLQSDARKWSTSGSNTDPTYGTTLAAMQNAWDITGVTVSNLDLLSKDDVASVPQSSRIVYNESGYAYYWWLVTPLERSDNDAYLVVDDGNIGHNRVDRDRNGVAPGFSISK